MCNNNNKCKNHRSSLNSFVKKYLFKLSLLCLVGVLLADSAFAAPKASRRSKGSSRSSTSKSRTGNPFGSSTGKSGSYYSGITNHEASAERQKVVDKEYAEQLQAAREGRPIPPSKIRNRADEAAARRQALDERRIKLAEEKELKKIELQVKKEERLAAAAERKAKKQERLSKGKKTSEDLPDPDAENKKKPAAKASTAPDKLEGF